MEIKKKFDINTLPISFYAHTLEFIDHNSFDRRSAIIFEAVFKDAVEMFVSGELPPKLPMVAEKSEYFNGLWENFKNYGIDSVNFLTPKAMYLSQASNAEIDVMMDSFLAAKKIKHAKNDWWEITIFPSDPHTSENKDACMFSIPDYAEIEGEFPFEIKPVSKETEQILYKLYTPYIDGKTTGKYITDKPQNAVKAIASGTVFDTVNVFYVGAGLCCNLADTNGNTIAYFDLGAENRLSTKRLRDSDRNGAGLMGQNKLQSMLFVLQDIINQPNVTIIISHWHNDHVKMLSDISNNVNYAIFWSNVEIICPDIVLNNRGVAYGDFMNVQGAMQRNGNAANFGVCANFVVDQSFNIGAPGPNILIFKCDRNDAANSKKDLHDHGITAIVTLNSGRTVFLAGDTYYDTLSVNNPADPILRQGYDYLVACHHGGKYTHTRAVTKNQYIPDCRIINEEAIFSANGVAYGHPNMNIVTEYQNADWVDRRTHSLLPPFNIIVLH